MKRAIVLMAVAVAIPTGAAYAKQSPTHTSHSHAAPNVMYVLKGTLSNYTAATSTAEGSISITVTHSNFHGRALKGQTLAFSTTMKTKVTVDNGATQITTGAKGVLKFKAPLRLATGTDIAAALPGMAKALHVIDQSHS